MALAQIQGRSAWRQRAPISVIHTPLSKCQERPLLVKSNHASEDQHGPSTASGYLVRYLLQNATNSPASSGGNIGTSRSTHRSRDATKLRSAPANVAHAYPRQFARTPFRPRRPACCARSDRGTALPSFGCYTWRTPRQCHAARYPENERITAAPEIMSLPRNCLGRAGKPHAREMTTIGQARSF